MGLESVKQERRGLDHMVNYQIDLQGLPEQATHETTREDKSQRVTMQPCERLGQSLSPLRLMKTVWRHNWS
jgi:hypothetical protein